jgi:hypothetical protein
MAAKVIEFSAQNIVDVYLSATPEQIAAGEHWYDAAQEFAQYLTVYGVTVEQAAGIIAALSPMNSWGANKMLAEKFIANGGLEGGYLGVGLRKAAAILAGEDIVSTLKSNKIVNFYLNIMGEDGVTCDRHAIDIAMNTRHTDKTRPGLTDKRYNAIADAYREAAAQFGIKASVMQSITWTAWRNRYWAEGAYDGV